jgi:hypothetical protein
MLLRMTAVLPELPPLRLPATAEARLPIIRIVAGMSRRATRPTVRWFETSTAGSNAARLLNTTLNGNSLVPQPERVAVAVLVMSWITLDRWSAEESMLPRICNCRRLPLARLRTKLKASAGSSQMTALDSKKNQIDSLENAPDYSPVLLAGFPEVDGLVGF